MVSLETTSKLLSAGLRCILTISNDQKSAFLSHSCLCTQELTSSLVPRKSGCHFFLLPQTASQDKYHHFFFTRTSLHVKPDHFSSSSFPLDLRIPLFHLGSRQERFGNPCMWLESQSIIWAFRQTVQPGEHHRLPSWKSRVLATSELRKAFKDTKISGNPTRSGKERLCLLSGWD